MNKQQISGGILGIIAIISAFFAFQLPKLQFDHSLNRFFPVNHPESMFFEKFRKTFGDDSNYFFIGLENSEGIFDKDFLIKADSLYQILDQLPEIDWVLAPTRIREISRNPISNIPKEKRWLVLEDETGYSQDSIRIYQSPWAGLLFANDRKSLVIHASHQENLTPVELNCLVKKIKSAVQTLAFEKTHYAGRCFGQTTFLSIIQRETAVFMVISLFIMMAFLWISYRRFWGIWMPIAVVGLSILWTIGLMASLSRPLDIISNIIPTLLLTIGIANAIHLLTYYLKERQKGMEKWEATKISIKTIGKATILTTLTTAFGFLSLTTSRFESLIELGIFASIGLFFAFILTYTFLPAIILLRGPFYGNKKDFNGFWEKWLEHGFNQVVKNQNLILIISGIIVLSGSIGALKIQINNYLLSDLSSGHPLQKDQHFFASQFGGSRSLECVVMLKDSNSNIFSPEILKELAQVETYLEKEYGASHLISPASIISRANQAYHNGNARYYQIPDSAAQIAPLVKRLKQYTTSFPIEKFISSDFRQARIKGYIPDWGSLVLEKKNKAFHDFLNTHFSGSPVAYTITGTPHLIDLNNRLLAQNVILGIIIATIAVAILFAFLFKSFQLAWITLIPNIIPLLFMAGIMGFLGIDLKISTSIIFIISFGIAVDDSIHFLSRFQKEIKEKSVFEAVKATYLSTGKAIVVTSLILLGGFSSLCFSKFEGTFYIGLLISIILLVALIADLTILPLLLIKFIKTEK